MPLCLDTESGNPFGEMIEIGWIMLDVTLHLAISEFFHSRGKMRDEGLPQVIEEDRKSGN